MGKVPYHKILKIVLWFIGVIILSAFTQDIIFDTTLELSLLFINLVALWWVTGKVSNDLKKRIGDK